MYKRARSCVSVSQGFERSWRRATPLLIHGVSLAAATWPTRIARRCRNFLVVRVLAAQLLLAHHMERVHSQPSPAASASRLADVLHLRHGQSGVSDTHARELEIPYMVICSPLPFPFRSVRYEPCAQWARVKGLGESGATFAGASERQFWRPFFSVVLAGLFFPTLNVPTGVGQSAGKHVPVNKLHP